MEAEFTEEEVVENPTLKAAYNLVPLHQKQPLQWDYEVELIGRKIFDKVIHLCGICELPILLYGRLLPCKHIFCFNCSRKCLECKRCLAKVQKVEELALGTVYVCTFGAPKHSTEVCGRTYLSQRDLQSHFAHRHVAKPSSEVKTQNVQPQLPLTQQQAAALQHTSQASGSNNQSALLPSTNQQVMTSSSLIPSLGGLNAAQEPMQLLNPLISGLGDMQTAASTSPIVSRASPDPKSSGLLTHPGNFNPQPQTNESSLYRPLDTPSLTLQLQQQQQQHLQHLQNQQQQHHIQFQQQQQQQQHQLHSHQSPLQQSQQHLMQPHNQPQAAQMMRLSSSPGMAPMSKSMPRFNQSQMPMSSSMLSSPGSHNNPYRTSSPGSSDIQLSTASQRRLQQSQNVSMHQQQLSGLMQQSHNQQLLFGQKNLDQAQSGTDMAEFYKRPSVDGFGGGQSRDKFRDNLPGLLNREDFNVMQQRKPFSSLQDDGYSARQNIDNYSSPQQTRDNFNTRQMMDNSPQQNRDNFNPRQMMDTSSQQNRDKFNPRQLIDNNQQQNRDNFNTRQLVDNSPQSKRDNFNPRQMMDKFNPVQSRDSPIQGGSIGDASKMSPNSQGGLARNKNVNNLITVPIQDEGQYRPLPFVGQSQLPMGVGSSNNSTFSSSMSVASSMPSNFSPHNQSNPRIPYHRPGTALTRHSQPGSLSNSVHPNPNMMNNPRGLGRGTGGAGINLSNVPPNALASMVQALSAAQGGAQGGTGLGQGIRMPSSGSLSGSLNSAFNVSNTGGNNWTIQPRMTHNLPRPKGDGQFKPNYF